MTTSHKDLRPNEPDNIKDPLSTIYGAGQWKLNSVSPLNNLQYSTVKLKQYASKLKQAIVSSGTANSSLNFFVNIEQEAKLRNSKEDPVALVIKVSVTPAESNVEPKAVYYGILMSWDCANTLLDAVHLPYYLERGEQRVGTAVKCTLNAIFDCNISQYTFTQQNLLMFAFNFMEIFSMDNQKQIAFTYTKDKSDHKHKMSINMDLEHIHILWTRVKENTIDSNISQQVFDTYQILQNQIFHMYQLDIAALDLIEITLPKVQIKCKGVIKMKTADAVKSMFSVLKEIEHFS